MIELVHKVERICIAFIQFGLFCCFDGGGKVAIDFDFELLGGSGIELLLCNAANKFVFVSSCACCQE